MYDDAEDQFFQGYPSQVKRPRPVLTAVVASAVTTIVVFFALRELETLGFIDSPRTPAAPSATAAAAAPTPAPAAPAAAPTPAAPAPAGAGAISVPVLVGTQLEQAREQLKTRGLLISISEERNDQGRPAGTILAQNPIAGTDVRPGSTVQVVISRIGAHAIVPPVAGQRVQDAMTLLTSQGYRLGPHKSAPEGTVAAGLVAGTDPPAGSSVPAGATISLLVAGGGGGVAGTVPNVVGTRLNRAKRMLEDAGFKVGRTRYKYDPCCGEYVILEQTPSANQPAAAGATVDLIVNEPG